MLTPSSPGWNIVVYPYSDILFALRSDCLSPGNILLHPIIVRMVVWFCVMSSVLSCWEGILPYWILSLLLILVLCTHSWMLHRRRWLICALFFLPAVSSICLLLVLLLLSLSLMCLFFLHLFIFVIVVVEWGPIVRCIQVCMVFSYFILNHTWLPHL
jgi:hypothetical protein